jgi:SAM-dependent methyltransferase
MITRPGAVFVDVGCADGALSAVVGRRVGAAQIIGLELGDQFIEPARRHGVDVRQADLTEPWPLDDASVDVLHSNQVIEHLAATDHFMSEIRRVLRPDGYAVVATNNLASWHNVVSLLIGWQPLPCHVSDTVVVGNPLAMEDAPYGGHIHRHLRIFTGRALTALAQAHGLTCELAIGAGYYPLGARMSRLMARLDPIRAAYLVQRYRVSTTA